jgi:CRISPR/Cas system-associated exonuclease Cas4 (RecB family)
MGPEQEALALDRLAQRLTSQFTDLGQTEVGQVVDDCLSQFVDSPIRTFVPLLVEHAARTRLQTMSPARVSRTTLEHSPPAQSFRQILAVGRPWAVL